MIVERTRWHRLDDPRLGSLPEGDLVRIVVREQPLVFVRVNGTLHAMLDQCPHQGNPISGGWVEDGHVVCPFHRFQFDPATGRCRHGMTVNIPTFPVQEDEEGVNVGFAYTTVRWFGIDLW